MKQADVKIGMMVWCKDHVRSKIDNMWLVDGRAELPTSTGLQHKWRLKRQEVIKGELKWFTITATSARLRHAP